MNTPMSTPRIVALGAVTFVVAVLGSLLGWVAIFIGDLSSGPLYCDESVQHSCGGDDTGAIILGAVLLGSLLLFVMHLVVRAISRPRGRKERWYFAGAALLLPMPTLSVLIPLVELPPSTDWRLLLAAAAAIGLIWTAAWCLAVRHLMQRASAFVSPSDRYPPVAQAR